jgi:hypothetical protein
MTWTLRDVDVDVSSGSRGEFLKEKGPIFQKP